MAFIYSQSGPGPQTFQIWDFEMLLFRDAETSQLHAVQVSDISKAPIRGEPRQQYPGSFCQ